MIRLRRWVLPATGASLGVCAVAALLAGEAVIVGLRPTPRPEHPAWRRGGGDDATGGASRAAPDRVRGASPHTPAPALTPAIATAPHETPALLAASGELAALARAADLPARLRWLDARLAGLAPGSAARLLIGLVDAPLPGDRYEAEALRLAALARLGALPGAEVDALLLARLDPERPRPERLVALELLAARPAVGLPELEHLARADHDPVVRDKARWALSLRGGRG